MEKWMHDIIHQNLHKEYASEFRIIDNLNQHPDGLTFEQWLERQSPVIVRVVRNEVPVSVLMRANIAPASTYADTMAELEEIRDTHQEQIDKASTALLESEGVAKQGMDLLLEGASVSVKIALKLEKERERTGELTIAAASLLGLIDALGGAGSLDDAGPDRKNLAELIDYPAIFDELKDEEDEEKQPDCDGCPLGGLCPDSGANRPVVPF